MNRVRRADATVGAVLAAVSAAAAAVAVLSPDAAIPMTVTIWVSAVAGAGWLVYRWLTLPTGPTGDPDTGPGDGPGPDVDLTPRPGDGTPTEARRGVVLDDMGVLPAREVTDLTVADMWAEMERAMIKPRGAPPWTR